MDIKNDIKNSVKFASDAATDAVQALVEKSRLRANANRIRQVIKSDTELRNQAYIELGRFLYENMRDNLDEEQEALCVVVDKTTKRIEKATKKYTEQLELIDETKLYSDNSEKLRKAVCSAANTISDKTKLKAQDIKQAAKESVAEISYKAKDKVEEIKAFIVPDEELEDYVLEQENLAVNNTDDIKNDKEQSQQNTDFGVIDDIEEETPNKTTPQDLYEDEESPEEFEF